MCMYCSIREEGWDALLQYDRTYQAAMDELRARETNYGFYDTWDDLADELTAGTGR